MLDKPRPVQPRPAVTLEEAFHELAEVKKGVLRLEAEAAERMEGWLNSEHFQGYADLTEDSLEGMIRRDEIPCYQLPNGRRRFKASDWDALLTLTNGPFE